MKSIRSLLKGETGAALIEFALVVPLLLALVVGIFEFGRAWNIYQVITDAGREGARMAVIQDGQNKQTTVRAAVDTRLQAAGIMKNGESVPLTYESDCGDLDVPTGEPTGAEMFGCGWGRDTGEQARVIIRTPYRFNLLAPIANLLGGGSSLGTVILNSNFVMRNE